ncbi:ASF1 anti-silencing function 1 [Sparganum proliferum]
MYTRTGVVILGGSCHWRARAGVERVQSRLSVPETVVAAAFVVSWAKLKWSPIGNSELCFSLWFSGCRRAFVLVWIYNPATFFDKFKFKITFECHEPLEEDPKKIPAEDLVGVTVVLIQALYRDQEFIRVGYYVNNEYTKEELRNEPPPEPLLNETMKPSPHIRYLLVLVLVTAAIMPDLAGLDDVPNCTSPRVTICGSGPRQLHPFPSPATATEYRRSKNHLHVLTDSVEPGFELTPSSTPPMGQWCRVEGSNTELLRWTTKNMPEPPQSSFLDGLSYPYDVVAASADCLI